MLAKSPPLSHAQSEVLKDAICQCTKKSEDNFDRKKSIENKYKI